MSLRFVSLFRGSGQQGEKSLPDALLGQACQSVLEEATEVIEKARSTLPAVHSYVGCLPYIQQSIRNPNDHELKREVLGFLAPNVDLIKSFYDIAKEIEYIFCELLLLCGRKELKKQASPLLEKLSDILDLALAFDLVKSTKPEIQNDLSYFRRLMAVNVDNNQLERFGDTPLSALSFFVANHFPFLRVLCNAVESMQHKDPNAHRVIAQVANNCVTALPSHRTRDPHLVFPTLRTMTCALLLYDHTSPDGAFQSSKSDIKTKRCLKELASARQAMAACEELVNSVKYASRHFQAPSTPEKFHAVLESA